MLRPNSLAEYRLALEESVLTADAPLHPDMRLLRDFAAGALDGHELDRVVEHLEQCGTCRAEVDGIATGDGLLDRLRQAATLAEGRPADHTERRRRAWALRRRIHRDSSPSAVSTAEPGLPIPPQDVANYEILREVGRGGMGVVYLARHRGLRRLVALKMILAGGFASEAERQRFQREAELAARVQHPNIVQVYEAGVHDGHPFLAMEWVSGITLADRIGPDPWPWHDAARLMETLALAIDAAHRKGVIHRDLKPSNILLQTDADVEPVGLLAGAVPKIADFGLARPIDGGDGLTSTGLTLGTPEYMAPEQANSGAAAGPGADVYALGAVLYQLLTARLPFMADTPIEILQALTTTEPVAPRRLRPSLPRDLETIVLKAIEKEPARRYATAGSMAEDLHRFLVGEPILAHAPTALTRLVKWAKRRPSLAALTVTSAVVTVVAFTGITALWVDATRARDRARAAAREAETRGDAERRALYQVAVAAAASELELNNLEAAQDLLEAAPEEYRNWEWQHFAAQLENAQTVFRTNEGRVSVLGLAPSGKLLAYATSGSHDVRVRVPGAPADLAVLRGGAGEVTSIAFSPDGSLLAVGATDRTVRVWSFTDSREAAVLAHHLDAPLRLVMAPDGSRLVACCKGGNARVWELAGGRCLADIKALDAQFSPDGRRLLTVHAGTVHLRDATTGESLRQWADPQQAFSCAVLSPDGRRMATGSIHPANRVCLWDVDREGSLVVLEGHKNTVFGLVFSHDGRMLASTSADKTVRLWDTMSDSQSGVVAILRGQHRSAWKRIWPSAQTDDGSSWRAPDRTCPRLGYAVEVTQFDPPSLGAPIATAETAVSQDGSAVAMADETGAISFWFVDDSMRAGLLTGHTGYVYDVAISRDGRTVASAAWDGTVRLWDAEEGRESLVLRHSGPAVTAVAISPDGRQVVSIAQDGVIRIWDSVTGRLARSRQLSGRRDQLVEYRIAYSPLGGLLAATGGHDKLVQLIDANTGELAANLAGHETEVSDAAFSPDGTRIASADCGGTVLFWTTADSVSMATIKAHDDLIHRIAFSPDGGVLATASQDRTVRLWDITTRRQLATLRHGTVVFGLAFNPDGTRFVAISLR